MTETLEERRARVAAERAAQGLPATGEDPAALSLTASILSQHRIVRAESVAS